MRIDKFKDVLKKIKDDLDSRFLEIRNKVKNYLSIDRFKDVLKKIKDGLDSIFLEIRNKVKSYLKRIKNYIKRLI